jgi:hypothetical protein
MKFEFKNKKRISLVMALVILPAILVWAGGTDGGGGSAVNCEPRLEIGYEIVNGKVKVVSKYDPSTEGSALSHDRKYELTDLWEAEYGYGPFRNQKRKTSFDAVNSTKKQIETALERLESVNPQFGQLTRQAMTVVQANIIQLSDGDEVLPPEDTDIRYMKKGCHLVGLGAYSDRENNLVIDPEVWKALSRTDRAAFLMHEAIYKVLRDTQHDDSSWRTRRIVGYLFSAGTFTWQEAFQQ